FLLIRLQIDLGQRCRATHPRQPFLGPAVALRDHRQDTPDRANEAAKDDKRYQVAEANHCNDHDASPKSNTGPSQTGHDVYTLMSTIFLMTIAPTICITSPKTLILIPKGSVHSNCT